MMQSSNSLDNLKNFDSDCTLEISCDDGDSDANSTFSSERMGHVSTIELKVAEKSKEKYFEPVQK